MIVFVKRLWAAAPLATAILALALAATVLFAVRAGVFWAHHHERVAREQPVAAWMTPGYIAMSWKVPREVILQALDAPRPPPRGRINLNDLAALNGNEVEVLIAEVEAAIADWRAKHGAPALRDPRPDEHDADRQRAAPGEDGGLP